LVQPGLAVVEQLGNLLPRQDLKMPFGRDQTI
jgi:hypothetical protein